MDLRRNVSFYFVSEATDFSKCSSLRKLEAWKKGTGRRKERRRRKSEVLTGGAKQFDPPDANFGDAKLPVTARNDRAKKSYGG